MLTACSPLVPTSGSDSESGSTTADGTTSGGPDPTSAGPTSFTSAGPVTSVGDVTSVGEVGGLDIFPSDTSSGPIVEELCIPAELHGLALESHPNGWVAFEGCDGDSLILETAGAPPLLSADALEPVADQYLVPLFGLPGAQSTGLGLCCDFDESALCLRANINRWDLQLNESLAYVGELFAGLRGGCIGVRLELVGAEGPRCEVDDPQCLPVPVCDGVPKSACCDAPPFDPGAARLPVAPELSAGFCDGDGECLVHGVSCQDYMSPQGPVLESCTEAISNAFCGCVSGSCTWYEQG